MNDVTPEPTREDVLIGRIVDAEATGADWDDLERIAAADPGVYERLARAQRVHARLERAVEDRIAIAEFVDLPRVAPRGVFRFPRRGVFGGVGWLAAAGLGVAWVIGSLAGGGAERSPGGGERITRGTPGPSLELASHADAPEHYWNKYVERGIADGRVVGEMPLVLVEVRPDENGGAHEVFFLRRVIERTTVTDLPVWRIQMDERGQPVGLPDDELRRSLVRPSETPPPAL